MPRVASHSASARKTCATLPVINARSTCSGGSVDASPQIQTTLSAPGFERATANEASAGSTPTTGGTSPEFVKEREIEMEMLDGFRL